MDLNIPFPIAISISQFRNLIGFQRYGGKKIKRTLDFICSTFLPPTGKCEPGILIILIVKYFLIDFSCTSATNPYLLQAKGKGSRKV